ncbi:unnamed protein product [Anisakis simplex]|uniref:Secreted protein n=1 Tax=Anisakis simplex TaxID=6269 RepID=A0A0M3KCA3_ANISI|nr:unnamed protein product [Anisakis simplex]
MGMKSTLLVALSIIYLTNVVSAGMPLSDGKGWVVVEGAQDLPSSSERPAVSELQ